MPELGVKKKTIVLFCVFLCSGLTLAFTAHRQDAAIRLGVLWGRPFQLLIQSALAVSFLLLVVRWVSRRELPRTALKLVFGIIFIPLVLLPVFRCCFKVPYIFCRVCPNKCPWGISRYFAFNALLLLNLSDKFWCTTLCPFGTFQECQTQLAKRSLKLPSGFNVIPSVILISVLGMYFMTVVSPRAMPYFVVGYYEWVTASVVIAAVIIAAAFIIPKFWCRYLCPVGTIAKFTTFLFSLPWIRSRPTPAR